MDEARQLIEERRYNDAITIISTVMKEDPRHFDEAESLMEDIRTARAEYNRVYNHLIDILDIQEGEELNEEEAYEIIRRLEGLDADPNEASVEAFAQARRSIIFTVNNQRFRGIMTEADQLLEEQLYIDAIDLYMSGFGLHRQRFEEDQYGAAAEQQADALTERIRQLGTDYTALLEELRRQMELFTTEGDVPDPSWEELRLILAQVRTLWAELLRRGSELEQLRDSIIKPEDTDVPYLSTLAILTKGRVESEKPNGIAGAIERPLVSSLDAATESILTLIDGLFQDARQHHEIGEYETAESQFANVVELIPEIRLYYTQWLDLHEDRDEYSLPHRIGPSQIDTESNRYYLQVLERSAQLYDFSIGISRRLDELEPGDDEVEEIRLKQEGLNAILTEMDSADDEIEGLLEEAAVYAERGVPAERALAVLSDLDVKFQEQVRRAHLIEGAHLVYIAGEQFDASQAVIENAEAAVDDAAGYVAGIEETIPGSETPVTVKYPQRSVRLIQQSLQDVQPERENISTMITMLDEAKEYITRQEQVRSSSQRGEELLERIRTLTTRSRSILATAEELNRNADIALSEGEIRLQQAQDALNNVRFEVARERLEQAGYALSESLTFREDPEVRRLIDERIPALAEEILFSQNQEIIAEVRALINRGRDLFFTENFIEAEQILKQAQSKWRLTHTEDDPEIELWLTRVRRALEATSGVVIEETDPLYADMIQVLNLAKEEFRKGRELYLDGERQAALDYFRQAEQKIEYIKEPFPNNQASGVLYLQILQYTQPGSFESILRERFLDARNKIEGQPEEAYRELQVLEEIQEDYPGLEDAIYRAEIVLGIRQPPPDPQNLARARELYSQAQRIVEQDIRAQFPIALTYLNEAIKLDPDYSEAIVLKDRIQIGSGSEITVVLSSVDQQKLRQAENLFIDGRYFEASALVEQLWQNPDNRSNPKLVELRRRIESQL